MSRKFVNTRSTQALRDYFAPPERPPTSATLDHASSDSSHGEHGGSNEDNGLNDNDNKQGENNDDKGLTSEEWIGRAL